MQRARVYYDMQEAEDRHDNVTQARLRPICDVLDALHVKSIAEQHRRWAGSALHRYLSELGWDVKRRRLMRREEAVRIELHVYRPRGSQDEIVVRVEWRDERQARTRV